VKIREAKAAELDRLRELYTEFFNERPPPPEMPASLDHELGQIAAYVEKDDHLALVAEDDGGEIVGFALAKVDDHPGFGYLADLYVSPGSRRQGAARNLIRESTERLREHGVTAMFLDVDLENAPARAAYERLGFRPEALQLWAPVPDVLASASREPRGESFASVHVQTDEVDAVEQAVRKYVPRFGRSRGSVVAGPRNGWIAVYDELGDREPAALKRVAAELSNATDAVTVSIGVEEGAIVRYAIFERGSIVDEYVSVPEYYKPLPPGDAIALGANATVVARLTGADAKAFKEVARTATTTEELPPPSELIEQIAGLMGLSGAGHGFEGADNEPRSRSVEHR
jgi:ribosomal protein S18 acetylase RimI-like enzyme